MLQRYNREIDVWGAPLLIGACLGCLVVVFFMFSAQKKIKADNRIADTLEQMSVTLDMIAGKMINDSRPARVTHQETCSP